jgi:predicted small secreted protein
MPRLVGKPSDASSTIALLFLLALAAGVSVEYLGYVNVVPGFGRDIPYTSQKNNNRVQ